MVREQVAVGDSAELQQELEKLRSRDLLTGLLKRCHQVVTRINTNVPDDPCFIVKRQGLRFRL